MTCSSIRGKHTERAGIGPALSHWGVETFLGFDYKVTNGVADAASEQFYEALNGLEGAAFRDVGDAASLHDSLGQYGNGDITLSPIIISVDPPEGSTLASDSVELTVTFDTKIDESRDPRTALSGSGPLQLRNSRWGEATMSS